MPKKKKKKVTKKPAKVVARRFSLGLKPLKAGQAHPGIEKVQKYLTRYGHLTAVASMGKLDRATSKAVESFQRSHGLRPTGNLTRATLDAMESARCGVPDNELAAAVADGPVASFTLRGCKYNKLVFTYRFVNGTGDIGGTGERAAVRRAFATWASVLCGVRFVERTTDPVDFRIGWFTGSHGDGAPFDGVGNTLAHAFYPPPCGGVNAGRMHFDDAETWSLTGAGATFDTETVALHEIGHLLGLAHSSVRGSVMFPSYGGVRRALTADDIDGIRRLYPFFCRSGDSGGQAGFVSEIAADRYRSRQIVNAVRTQAGTLKLIAWRVNANGSITRTGDSGSQAGRATSIDIARARGSSRFVTAVRAANGRLKLISWDLNASGSTITRAGDSGNQAGRASRIQIISLTSTRFVTAVRTASGRLKLILWRLNSSGSISRLGDSGNAAGAASEISLVRRTNQRMVTAVRTGAGRLKLISWLVVGNRIRRTGDSGNQAGAASRIHAVRDSAGRFVTAVRTAGGNLKLIAWRVPTSGAIQRLGDSGSQAGTTLEHDIMRRGSLVITPVRTAGGFLKLIAWRPTAGPITRVGDSDELAGSATLITSCPALTGVPPVVTSVRTTSSSLKLISWRF